MNTRSALGLVAGFLALAAVVVGVAVNISMEPAPPQPGNNIVVNVPPADMNRFLQVPQVQNATPQEVARLRGKVVPARDYEISGPYTHANLAVFLVHGADALQNQGPVTLQEALALNEAVVRDTGVVLTVDNLSKRHLFIQAGDIVKGGNQDRVLPYDQLIPPETKTVTLAAYCVEAGRSGPRGEELSASFEMSSDFLPSRGLKQAALYRQSQADVWAEVARLQDKLSRRLGESVQAPLSPTSLQLTLEHPRLTRSVLDYVASIDVAPQNKDNAIGCVVAINGQVQVADVYASNSLFARYWGKLLKAAAVDALAESQPDANTPAPSLETVRTFLTSADQGQVTSKQDIAGQTLVLRQESGQAVLFDTCSPGTQNLVVHRTFLAK